jgi:serine/threonine-protein kinase PpkA
VSRYNWLGIAFVLAWGGWSAAALAGAPLLIDGKKTLYQRILTHPGAQLRSAPGPSGKPMDKPLPAFSVFYVYGRQTIENEPWVQIGAASSGEPDGWLPATQFSDWKQTLVLKFAERSGRTPVLFFRTQNALATTLNDPAPTGRVQALLEQAKAAKAGQASAGELVALEPVDTAVPQDRFYLLPIFNFSEAFTPPPNSQPVSMLQVASIDPGSGVQTQTAPPPRALKTAMVFVIDTTLSMDPYIDRTRLVVGKLYDAIHAAKLSDKVSFGLVAYRNSLAKTPGLEYVSRVYANLEEGQDRDQFLNLIGNVKATKVSSHTFSEDAFNGIMTALDNMDWSDYGARVLFLITDAGAIRNNDLAAATGLNEGQIREVAQRRQVKIFVLHLRTPQGAKNHALAETQYRQLTADPNPRLGDLYVPIPTGDVNRFGAEIERIAAVFTRLIQEVATGKPLSAPPPTATPVTDPKAKAEALGYAMQMDFLGRVRGAQAPRVVTAWVADHDLANPAQPAFQVCILLSKWQLNALQQGLKLIVDAAAKTRASPQNFFQEVASAAANLSRDPSRLRQKQFNNLYESGLLSEFLEGLPYKSKVLGITQELWLSWSAGEQQDFIDELQSKIRLYEKFHNDISNWISFGNATPGDAVYRAPLSALP